MLLALGSMSVQNCVKASFYPVHFVFEITSCRSESSMGPVSAKFMPVLGCFFPSGLIRKELVNNSAGPCRAFLTLHSDIQRFSREDYHLMIRRRG
jgi:hypothetical protein